MFPFGAQYLRAASPHRSQWENDLAMAASRGFNTMRVWLVWSYLQPTPDFIDIGYVMAFLDTCHRNNLKAILLMNIESTPGWLNIRYPQARWEAADGFKPDPQMTPNQPSGGAPGLCWDHLVVREAAEYFMEVMVNGLKEHPALAIWECMNEPILEPARQLKRVDEQRRLFCYCPQTQSAYQVWMQAKYGDIDSLNEAWGSRFGDWAEIQPPRFRASFQDMMDWRLFAMDRLTEVVRWRADFIKSLDQNHPVMTHTVGDGGGTLLSDIHFLANDEWKIAECVDIFGMSSFLRSGTVGYCAHLDATKSMAGEKPWWLAEMLGNSHAGALIPTAPLDSRKHALWIWEAVGRGAKGVLYWSLRPELHGAEDAHYGLTEPDGAYGHVAEAAASLGRYLQEHGELFERVRPEKSEVAILFCPRNYLLDWIASGSNERARSTLTGYYQMLWEENIPVDFLHEERLEQLNSYKMLIIPFGLSLQAEAVERIRNYVRQGGTVLADAGVGTYDQRLLYSMQVPTPALAELFGAVEQQIDAIDKCSLKLRSGSLVGSVYQASYELTSGQAIGWWDAERLVPALICNRWGDGKAYLVGTNISSAYSTVYKRMNVPLPDSRDRITGNPSLAGNKGFLIKVLAEAGVTAKYKTEDFIEVLPLIISSSRQRSSPKDGGHEDKLLIVINHMDQEREIALRLGSSRRARCLDTGEEVPDLDHQINLAMAPYGVRRLYVSQK